MAGLQGVVKREKVKLLREKKEVNINIYIQNL